VSIIGYPPGFNVRIKYRLIAQLLNDGDAGEAARSRAA
jgi:hypothetical protein